MTVVLPEIPLRLRITESHRFIAISLLHVIRLDTRNSETTPNLSFETWYPAVNFPEAFDPTPHVPAGRPHKEQGKINDHSGSQPCKEKNHHNRPYTRMV